jgi:glycosyltransferase involved in cell wall biosynthesis
MSKNNNNHEKKGCFLGLNLSPESGGPFKTIQLFKQAIGGSVVSMDSEPLHMQKCSAPAIQRLDVKSEVFVGPLKSREFFEIGQQHKLLSCHGIFRYHNNLVKRAARKFSLPYWAVPHGSMDPWVFTYGRMRKELWFRSFGRNYFRDAAHVILATERERDKMRERFDHPNMRVVHWPVEQLDLLKRDCCRKSLRLKLGLPKDARLLLYFGRFHSMKKPLETIQKFKRAKLSERIHLLLVGFDGDLSMEQLLAEANGCPAVHVRQGVHGSQRDEVLLGCDAYVSLSSRENFNHAAAEAMTGQQALILSPGNDLQYSFPDNAEFGWMLEENGEDSIIEAMRAFDRSSDSQLRSMGKAARDWACRELSFQQFQSKLSKLYYEATGEHC